MSGGAVFLAMQVLEITAGGRGFPGSRKNAFFMTSPRAHLNA